MIVYVLEAFFTQ